MPVILQLISKLERAQAVRCTAAEELLTHATLADDTFRSVLSQYEEWHGPAEFAVDWVTALEKGIGQWVPLFQESGQPTDINENQLIQMFDHANTSAYVHRSALQEPRAPEQATHIIPAVTPPQLELRAFLDIPREPEDLRT